MTQHVFTLSVFYIVNTFWVNYFFVYSCNFYCYIEYSKQTEKASRIHGKDAGVLQASEGRHVQPRGQAEKRFHS